MYIHKCMQSYIYTLHLGVNTKLAINNMAHTRIHSYAYARKRLNQKLRILELCFSKCEMSYKFALQVVAGLRLLFGFFCFFVFVSIRCSLFVVGK